MAFFQSTHNRKVILQFDQPWDVEGMRVHPDYVEVSKDGVPVGPPKSDQRPDWQIPFTRVSKQGKGK